MSSDVDASQIPIHNRDSEGDLDLLMDLDLCSDELEDINVLPTEELYDFNMVAEQSSEEEDDPDSPEGQKRRKKKEFWKKMQSMM
eukprot:2494056-Karenia_brevis.AAC.1